MAESNQETTYWKSLNELAQNQEYKKFVEREFPEDATEMTDQVSRRSFLRVMGASIALAGFASCRKPMQKVIPYTKQPEDVIIGVPNYYATSMPFQDTLTGLVIENNEGRPTKAEGNEQHPASMGNTSIYHQASILEMYDPDRSRHPRFNGEKSDLAAFEAFALNHFSDTSREMLVLAEPSSSPTFIRLKNNFKRRFPNTSWLSVEAFGESNSISGNTLAFGRPLRTMCHFDKADRVVSFGDDFLSPAESKNSVEYAGKCTERRRVRSTQDDMSRIYVVEHDYTLTGAYADHRIRLKRTEIEPFMAAVAESLSKKISGLDAYSGVQNAFTGSEWVEKIAEDLTGNAGKSLLTAGRDLSDRAHATAAAMNVALGNVGTTCTYHEVEHLEDLADIKTLQEAIGRLQNGSIDTVLMVGGNPVLTFPSDLNFTEALSKAGTSIHLASHADETSRNCTWHINSAHYLESWGDGLSFTGIASVIQPQILPLFDGLSEIEFLSILLDGKKGDGHALIKETWQRRLPAPFERNWEKLLHDGMEDGSGFPAERVRLNSRLVNTLGDFGKDQNVSTEIVIKADPKLFDGRFANIGWLQELPDPMTKITWDNVALMSPATARKLGIRDDRKFNSDAVPVVKITTESGTIEIPAWPEPGHADDSITLYAGYGRTGLGRVADGVGVNVYPLRTSMSMSVQEGTISPTGTMYDVACVQDHHSLEGRDMIRMATLDEYREKPDFATYKSVHGYQVPGIKEAKAEGDDKGPISLFTETYGSEDQPQWGMAIDLNSCFGCGVCTIACQAENNIPVIGKREVSRRRIMHWIRTDRYYEGSEENPSVYHQPVPCMHCELAPCEQVCPVAATVHSEDGMNQMTYNRCIGTRYCANNCPFKVRRFNFFNYAKEYLTTGDDPEIIQMAMNPDVTVRFRGVMEKCTYCVQRVNRAKSESRLATGSRKPEDGAVQTACQQACPANAISFGDLTDRGSHVSQDKLNERNYVMLEELNVRPRTSYMAKLTHPAS